jgi:DNA-directed RNA polymerase subunit B
MHGGSMFPELTESYLRENSLVKQYVESYNKFVESGMQQTVNAQAVIEPEIEGVVLKLGKVRVEKPTVTEVDGSKRQLYPIEARLRDLSYTAPVFLEMTTVVNGVEKKTEDVFIGELPVMAKSRLCYLHGLSKEELIEKGEDPMDPGGYFIINGTEKTLMTLEDLAPNRILVSREKVDESVQAKVFSTRAGFRGRCTVDRTKEGRLSITLPSYSKALELVLVLKALGLDKNDRILEEFHEEVSKNDVLLNIEAEEAKNKREALETIGKRAAPGQPVDYQLKRAELLLDRYLLPHIGIEENARLAKAFFLCRMAERAILVSYKKRGVDDKDHYANKRLKIAGKLMEELFRYAFGFLVKDVAYQLERANVRGRKMSIFAVVRPDALSERIRYSMATGNWVEGHTGVSQPLDRYNFLSAVSFLRRVTSPLARKHPHYKARDLNGTHFGRLDPNETPEGPNCGLVKNLAIFCEVTTGCEERPVENFLKKLGVSLKEGKGSVFLNGRFIGFSDSGERIVKELRETRRRGEIDYQMNAAYYEKTDEVFINTDGGRARRPLIVVKRGKKMLSKELVEKVGRGEMHWSDLIGQGAVEYLDAEEEENSFIALSEEELEGVRKKGEGKEERYTHMEVDPVGILGYASNQVPFPEHNMAPRVLMAAQHTKQSLGLYASSFNLRTDTRGYVLFYPQRPLVQTRVYNALENWRRASGQNFVVAVISYYGHNMNDAIVVNKSAIDRALGRNAFLRSYSAEERRYPGGQRDKFCVPEEFVQGFLGEEAYANLDELGVINPETTVAGDSVLVGKTSPPRFLKEISALDVETEKRRESSVTVRSNESGVVDSIILSETTAGNKFIKTRVRRTCVPEIGDKFASRHGQKGVIAFVENQEDLPFTESGIVPDLILNPHAIPGRMTAGHLLEMLAGKAACVDGKLKDGTAFTGVSQENVEEILKEKGFDYAGEETMFDGRTGAMLCAKIFVGVVYYQRLHHLVSLKMHARSRGPVQMLTHQPTEGRAREGGLRLGEMERDCFIGFGAASLLRERMIESSDKTVELVCSQCGSLAVFNKVKNQKYCPLCESSQVHEVEMSYAFKLLLDEMKSVGIFPKLRIRDRG